MSRRFGLACCFAALFSFSLLAQETRSTLSGRVLDPQGASIAGAVVVVRIADTGVALTFKTNETGYYGASLLIPGNYELTAEMTGFKKLVRKGVSLPVSSSLVVNLDLEIGGVAETISVTAEAPLLETTAVTSGRVIDNKTLMELPVMGNSAITLVRLTPGMQTGGVNNYLALHSNVGGSDYQVDGNVGQNSWTLDGSPNTGPSRRLAYLPYTDAVSEFKVETNNFDAAIGQSTGAAITMISKSGTNGFHGTATWQHWQQRWQGTPFFPKQSYYRSIAAAEAAGNTALANQIRNTDKQLPGRSNNWGASGGGPVILPKIYNGRNKLFWFFTYNALKEVKTEDPSTFNRTVPTVNARNGDFSDMLSLGAQYTIYDPLTVRRDPGRPSNYIRTPFPNNIIPKARFVNPSYDAITKLYPLPNNPPAAGQQPVNNYLSSKAPYNWDYKAFSNRVDYQVSNKLRMFGRWSYNNFAPEDRADWTYETARGLNVNGLVRNNKGGNVDVVYTQNSSTIWDFNIALNQFREGNVQPYALALKPTDIGLPAYLDQKAGDLHILPLMQLNAAYTQISPAGISTWTRYRIATGKVETTHIRGKHTFRAAFDNRYQYRTGGGGGNTSGAFTFDRTYTRRDDDGNAPSSQLGLTWAAFILGIPSSMSVQTNDNYAMLTPYYGSYVQDSWRVSPKLTVNLGLRVEYEGGSTERYNRLIGGFDPTLTLPITAAAQAAYAANPIAELPASQFKVLGGTLYPGTSSQPRSLSMGQLMWLPRVGVAYQLNGKTVIRGGYGIYFDTIDVLNFGPDQSGYSRTTSTTLTTDAGVNWNSAFPASASPANNNSPLKDPFPVRADGTRFDVPTGSNLGIMAKAGRGFSYTDFNQQHARQQRWRFSVQRQIGQRWVIDAAYSGSYSDRIAIGHKLDVLPEQYWANGTVRNDAIASNLNFNVPNNPFQLANFASLKQSSPLIYQDMGTQGFYTSSTIRRSTLLRAFPQMNGNLTNNTTSDGMARTHDFELSVEKRFSHGFNLNFGYTALKVRAADFYFYEWDTAPTWRSSNNGRPQRIVGTGVFDFPFGRGKRFGGGASKWVDLLIGGWRTSATYEFQPGALLDWGNVFYYGSDTSDITNVNRTWDTWFNTANFERCAAAGPRPGGSLEDRCDSAKGPNSFHRRVFPTRIPDLRADKTSQWNANMAKNIHLSERVNMQMRLDVLNVQNRSQMQGPNTDPFSTNFGKITSQSAAINRWLQVQARVTF